MIDISAFPAGIDAEKARAVIDRVWRRASDFVSIIDASSEEDRARKFLRLAARFDAAAFRDALRQELAATLAPT